MSQNFDITDENFQSEAPLALPENEVHLWRTDLDAVRGEESRWRELLSPDEWKRADRFHFDRDRQRFSAARAVLRKILAAYLAADFEDSDLLLLEEGKTFAGAALFRERHYLQRFAFRRDSAFCDFARAGRGSRCGANQARY